jgi:hypothetical protein
MSSEATHQVVRRLAAVSIACLSVAGCSFGDTPESVAKELIEGELAAQLGLGEITAECEAPPNRDAGTTFSCTSATDHGEVLWLATMEDESTVNVESTNVLSDANVTDLETETVALLEEELQATLGPGSIECGQGPIVLGVDLTLVCAGTEPTTGDVYDVTIQITDVETGAFNVEVADTPR